MEGPIRRCPAAIYRGNQDQNEGENLKEDGRVEWFKTDSWIVDLPALY